MPSTAISVGLIGFGLSGRVFHAPFLAADPAFRLEAIATGDPERAGQAATQHPGAAIVSTPDELIARGLDLVVLASPAQAHFEQAMAALEAGSAVVIDKPFVPSVVAAKQLCQRAEELALPLVVFQNRRWDGDFLTIERLLAEGRFGRVHRFESTFERWGTPKPGRWQETSSVEEGAGITYDLGSHLIDQALHLFGPATVEQAEMSTVRGAASEDDSFISLLHAGGVRSHLTMSRAAGQSGPRFRVLGDAGSYSVHGLDNQEQQLRDGVVPSAPDYAVTPEQDWGLFGLGSDLERVPTERGAYPTFYAGVAASIRDGAPVPVPPRESVEVVRIIERAHEMTRQAELSAP